MEDNKIADVQIEFKRSELLPRVTLKSAYVVSQDGCFRTKYKSKAILANDANLATLLPMFGKIERISQVLGFVYFELNLIQKFLGSNFNHMKYMKKLITAQQLFPMIILSIKQCITRKQLGIVAFFIPLGCTEGFRDNFKNKQQKCMFFYE